MAHQQAARPPGRPLTSQPLLTPGEVAALFRVDPKTVTRWARAGKLASIRTLGGHRRYPEPQVRRLLATPPQPATTRSSDRVQRGGEDDQRLDVDAPTHGDDLRAAARPDPG